MPLKDAQEVLTEEFDIVSPFSLSSFLSVPCSLFFPPHSCVFGIVQSNVSLDSRRSTCRAENYIYLLEISRQMAARGRKSSGCQIGTGRPRMSAAGGEDRLWQTLHSMAATTTTAQSTAENTNLSIKRHQPPDNKKPGGGVGSEGWRRGGRGKHHGEKDTAREGSQKNIMIKRQISEIHADSNP